MSASPPSSDPDRSEDDDLESLSDEELSGQAASDPEEARAAAEDALAQVESLADLDDDPSEPTQSEVPAQASSVEKDPSPLSEREALEDQCENCGALLQGPYCSECGQQAADRVVPLWHMLNEVLEAVFELDMRVVRTFPKFLFLPGRLTKEYLNGRRKRYIRPFRLYLFTTFLLFTILALTTGQGFQFPFDPQVPTAQADTAGTTRSLTVPAEAGASASLFGSPQERAELARQIRRNPNSVDVKVGAPETQSQLEQYLRIKVAESIENPREFIGSMIDRGPYVMFLMLPLFAFLLKLLYIRRSRLYVEHLIFSLHIHAFSFFAFTVGILLNETNVGWLNTAADWIELSPLLYLVVALAHVYDQGFIKSTFKAFFLFFFYTIILALGFVVLALAAVVFM